MEGSDVAPENVTVKRVGEDLLVQFEGSEKPDLTIQDFFAEGMDTELYGVAENGQLYAYVRTDGEGFGGTLLLADGESAPIALGGDSLGDGAAYLASTFDDAAGFVLWPWLLGLAGVGAAAAAIINHNKDNGHHHHQDTSPAPTNVKAIDDVGPIQGPLHDGDITDDAKPEISGNGVPGAIIHVIDNGTEIGSTVVNPDGTWSYTPTTNLDDGPHEIDVIQDVPGDKPSDPTRVVDIVVDTIAPDAPTVVLDPASDSGVQGDNITNDTTPTIDGKTEPGADVAVIFPTGEEIHTKADENGDWSVTPTQPLPEGNNDITVIATDPAGNSSEPTVITVVIDTAVPSADAWLDPASDSGTKGDGITNDTLPTIDGKTEPGSEVVITFPTGETATTTADANGDWSVTPTQPLPEGNNDIVVVVTDPAGNTSEPTVLPIVIDTTIPPADAWLDPASDSGTKGDGITNDPTPTIDGKTEPGSEVVITFPTGETATTTADANGDWSVTPTQPLPEGNNDIVVVVTDPAGNTSEPTVLPIVIDTTIPPADAWLDPASDSGTKGDGITNDPTPTIDGKTEPGSEVVITFPTGEIATTTADANGDWSVTPTQPLPEGNNDIVVVVTDPAGNASEPNVLPIVIDTTAPSAPVIKDVVDNDDPAHPIDIPKDGATNDTTPVISGDGAEKGDIIHVFDGETELGSTTAKDDGSWSFEVPADKALDEGEHEFTVKAEDPAGNISDASEPYSIVIDTTAPSAPTIDKVIDNDDPAHLVDVPKDGSTNDTTPVISGGGAEKGDIIHIFDGKDELGSVTVTNDDGTWSFEVPADKALKEGEHDFTVKAEDPAGNTSDASEPYPISIDTTTPSIPVIKDVVDNDDPDHPIDVPKDGSTNDTTPVISGDGAEKGDIIHVFDGETELGSTTAKDDGSWSFEVPAEKALEEGEHEFTVKAEDPAGNISEPSAPYPIVIDTVGPDDKTTHLTINTVAGDDVLNAAEAEVQQTISGKATGEFQQGDIVSFTLNGTVYSAKVAADGTWGVQVAGSDLAKETNIHATLVAHDAAGNAGNIEADHGYKVVIVPGSVTLAIDVVAGDDVVNLAESKTEQTISGKVVGEFTTGDLVSFKLNSTTYSAAVDKNGNWSVKVAGADLAAESNIHATLVAHDAAGNISNVVADHSYAVDVVAPVATLTIDKVAGDDIVNLDESTVEQTVSGKASGEFQTGDVVSFTLNGTTYSAAVDKNGNWSVKVAGADLAAETNIHATLVAHDAAGNSADVLADHAYTVVLVPPVASVNINIVAGDDIVNLDESKVDQQITGGTTGGRAGDIVTIVVNDVTYSGKIDAAGKWSISVPGSELVADADHRIDASFVATDAAGNRTNATATHDYSVDITPPVATLTINTVAGDDIVNLEESKSPQTISGKATGEFKTGDIVSFALNGTTYSAAVDKDGSWSVSVSGADLAKETNIHATLVAHDTAGNVANVVADHGYSVDTTPPVATLTINPVTEDDILNYVESQTDQTISGKVAGEFQAGDIVSFALNGTDYSAAVAEDGTWSVMVAGADLAADTNIHATLVAHDAAGNSSTATADHPYEVSITPPVAGLVINPVTDDNTLNLEESKVEQTISGKATGEFQKGDVVSFTLNGTDYSAAVAADGSWSVKVAGADLAAETSIDAILVAHDEAGNASEVEGSRSYTVDIAPPVATLTINPVAGDDIVNIEESKSEQTISGKAAGEFKAGDLVSFTLNGTEYSAKVAADGRWSVKVAGADLAAETNIHATLIAHDSAGNSASVVADHGYGVDLMAPVATLTISVVAGDDVVNAAEAMTNQTISGKAAGDFQAGDVVSFTLNGTEYSTKIAADGSWSVQVSGTDLAKGTSIDATLVAHDAAGNSSDVKASHPYTVDLTEPVATLTIDTVAGDDIVNIDESKVPQTISGKVVGEFQDGDIVSFKLNSTTYSTTVDKGGNWSVKVAGSDLAAETNIHATLVAHDDAGNVGIITADHGYTVDTTAPSAPTITGVVDNDDPAHLINIPENGSTNDTTPVISGGGAEKGDIIHVFDGETELGSTTAKDDGSWSFEVPADKALDEGEHDFTVKAEDPAGNISDASEPYPITIDTTTPSAPTIKDVVDNDDPNHLVDVPKNGSTNDTTPVISGDGAEKGDIIHVFDGDKELGSTVAKDDGSWSFEVPADEALDEGEHDFTVKAEDPAGNISDASEPYPIVIDTTAPSAPTIKDVVDNDDPNHLVDVPKNGSTNDTTPVISGDGAEKGDIIHVFDGDKELGSTVANDDGTWSFEVPADKALDEGEHDFTVKAEDPAGNISDASEPYPIVIDTTAPSAPTITGVVDNDDPAHLINVPENASTNDTTPVISGGGAEKGDIIHIFDGKDELGSVTVTNDDGTWSFEVPADKALKEGDHDFTAKDEDPAGNISGPSNDFPITIDLTPPDDKTTTLTIDTVAGDDIVNLNESKTTQTISGKAGGEFQTGDIVSFKLNGTTYSAAVDKDGKWSVDVAGSDLAKETNIHATLVAHDAAGNAGSISADHAYTVDLLEPVATLTINVVAGDDIVNLEESKTEQTISGKAGGEFQTGDIVSFKLNGTTYSAAVDKDGKWSVDVAGSDLAKETSIHATLVAHDAAGNSSNVTADHAYTVITDLLNPSLNINVVAGDDIVNLDESKVDQAITGSTTGGRAGDIVTLVVNGVTYSGAIDAQGKWSISVPGSGLVADADHRIDATFVATDRAGNTASATATHDYSVDITPPVTNLTINVVAGDDVVNLAESKAQQTISGKASGEFQTGDIVSFKLNGTTYSAAVDKDGNWSVKVAGADLAKETNIHATLEAHDTAGNSASVVADHGYSVDLVPPVATLTINNVTEDNVLNYVESQTDQIISGKAGGEFLSGDIVSFELNGTTYSAAVDADGNWSVKVDGFDLSEGTSIDATLVAHDAAGNSSTATADHPYEVNVVPPVAGLVINPVAGDDIVNIAESKTEQTISGKATGEFKAGDLVSFELNGTTYSAKVAADGNWSVKVAGSDLIEESSINAILQAHDDAGNVSEVPGSRSYGIDLTPPVATLTINTVAGDDIVNLAESKAEQTISGKASGEFQAGDLVSFKLNGTTYSAAVDAAGNWSVKVAGADLAADTNIHATLVAHDAAGNSSSAVADHGYSVDLVAPVATLTINVVAGDDIVNAAEAMTNQTISGKAGGEFKAGDLVTFTLNGTDYSAKVAADGNWSVQVSGTDLAKGTSIDATLVAHDVAGNSTDVKASHPYTVDLVAPVATLTINTVAGDDVVNLEESKVAQPISGKVTGEFQEGDIVSFKLNGTTYSAAVDKDGNWSTQVAGSDLAKETNIHATLVAHDVAGNVGIIVADHGYTVDIIAPSAPVITGVVDNDDPAHPIDIPKDGATNDTTPVISGDGAEKGDIIHIFDGKDELGSVTVTNDDGTWSFDVPAGKALDNGEHDFIAKAEDPAGNISDPSNDFPISIVTDKPNAPVIKDVVDNDDPTHPIDVPKDGSTNDTTPVISGDGAQKGDIIHVFDGETELGSTTAKDDGSWSFEVPADKALEEGEHDFTVKAEDPAGNISDASEPYPITIDTTTPSAPTIKDVVDNDDPNHLVDVPKNGSTNDTTPVISGDGAEKGDIIHVFDGDKELGSTVAKDDGSWSFEVPADEALDEGEHDFTVKAEDPAGNISDASEPYPITIDTTTPSAPTIKDVVDNDDPAHPIDIPKDGATNDTTPVISGDGAEKGDIIHVFDGETELGSTTAKDDGTWSFEVPADKALDEGEHDFTVKAEDPAGNISDASEPYPITIDTTTPSAPTIKDVVDNDDPNHLVDVPKNGSTNDTTPVISGDGAEKGDIIHVFDGDKELGSTVAKDDGSWSFEVPADEALDEGEHDFTVKAEDPAGNISDASEPYPIVIDTTAPSAPTIKDVVDNDDPNHLVDVPKNGSTNDTTPVISGDGAEKGDVIHVFDGETELGSVTVTSNDGTWSFEVPADKALAEGEHDFTAKVEDPAGNVSGPSNDFPITVDLTPPVATLSINVVAGDDIVNLAESLVQQTISGKAGGEFQAGDIVSFKLNGTTYSAAVDGSGVWSVQVAGSDLAKETNIHATLVAHDAAGNSASVVADHSYTVVLVPGSASLAIDVVAGDDIVNLAESQTQQTISGKAAGEFTAGDVVSFTLNGTDYSTKVAADGSWSVKVAGADLAAETNIHATLVAHDAAGNISSVTADHAYLVDIVPPVVTLTINTVAGDDMVNLEESTQPQTISGKVSGEFQVGDLVSFKLNGNDYSAKVDKDGNWSTQVAGSDLAKETNIHATLVAHDAAGNSSEVSADHPYTVITDLLNPSLNINIVAGDDVINLEESKVDQAITGNTTGGRAGDIVTLVVNGVNYSGAIDGQGKWSIKVPGSELVADTDHRIDATFVATDVAGNSASAMATHDYSVDITPPVATLTINTVAGDDIVNLEESKSPQTISGKATGEFKTGDIVSFDLNGTTYSAAVDKDGNWSVSVSGADLAKETNVHATLVAHDTAGNVANVVADHGYSVDTTPPVATLTINPVTEDDILNYVESQTDQTISGKVAGEFQAGDIVSFALNGTDYSAAVAEDGTWSVMVAGADLAADTNIHATLVAHDAAGNSSTATADHPYEVSITPPVAGLVINPVTDDNTLNLEESKVEQTISGKATGEFQAGDVVSFTLNGTDYSAKVAADGSWSVKVAGADLAAETKIDATLVAHDEAGNASDVAGSRSYSVDITPPVATLSINVVAGDDIVNLAESKTEQTISGKAGGEFKAGDVVSFALNGTTYSAAVDASGNWSVKVAGADLAADTNIHATLVAHDAAGNSSSVVADHGYSVDLVAPVATLTINVVTGDDVVNAAEAMTNQTISGKAGGEFMAGDIVSFKLNGTDYSAKVAADGSWSVQVSGTDLAKGTSIDATLVAHDVAGNSTDVKASHPYTVDLVAPVATLTINTVAGDDVVNLEESKVAQPISGKVTGEFQEGDIVSFKLNSTTYSAAVDKDGNWSVNVAGSDLAKETNIHATLVAHDDAGNVGIIVADHGYTVDIIAPSAPVITGVVDNDDPAHPIDIPKDGATNDTTPVISGDGAQKGDIIHVFDGETELGTTTAKDDGSWSFEVPADKALDEGEHDFTVKSEDPAGNISDASEPYPIVIDTTAPSAPTITGVVDNDDPAHLINIPENGSTNDTTPVISGGGAEKGDIIHVFDGETELGTTTAKDDGSWSFEVPADKALDEGEHDFTVKAEDPAGNISDASEPYPITIDTTAPSAPTITGVVDNDDPAHLINIPENGSTNDTTPVISGGGAEKGDIIHVFDGETELGTTTAKDDGSWSFEVPAGKALDNGEHDFIAKAEDPAGNISDPSNDFPISIVTDKPNAPVIKDVVDNDDPTHPIDVPKDGSTNDTTPVISGDGAEKGDIIHVFDGETELGTTTAKDDGSWSFEVPADEALDEGEHDFTVKAEDPAGNISDASEPYPIVIDTTAPSAPTITGVVDNDDPAHLINVPENASTNDTTPVISGGGAEKGDIIHIFDGKDELGSVTVTNDDGTWSFEVPADKALKEGDHDFTAKAEDPAGNISGPSNDFPITIDLTPPDDKTTTLIIDTVAGDDIVNLNESKTTQTISGKAGGEFQTGDIVSFKLNGTTYSAAVDKDGKWSVDVAGSDLAKETNIHATLVAHDAAGNAGSISADHAYTVDLLEPVATLTINVVAGDDIVNLEESKTEQTISGKAGGEFQTGDIVSFKLNGTTYSAAVDKDGKWSVDVAGSDLAKETSIHATLVAHDAAGNSSNVTADHAYTVITDLLNPSLNINVVAGDDIVNLDESKVDQAITGSTTGGRAGDIVTLVVNGVTYSGAIDAQGKWSISVPGSGLVADADHRIDATFVATDRAGNTASATATHDYSVDITPPVTNLTINVVAGDDVVNLAESKAQQTISGKASGEFQTGDIVSFKLNGTTYSAAVDKDGNWSVKVAGADLAKETNIHATLEAHDTAGNSASVVADHGYSVDLVPPVATLTINNVTEDNVLNYVESQTDQIISGKAGGEFLSGDIVSFELNGTTYSAAVDADGNWSVKVDGFDLSEGTSIDATLVAHDAAGNSSTATADHPYEVNVVPPVAGLVINPVAGDDIVNIAESKTEQTISGKATGEFKAGDLVSFELNGTTYSAKVAADGNWSVKVAGSDLIEESSINAILQAHDDAGNVSEVPGSRSYGIDLTPPVATLTINTVAGDDIVNLAESKAEQTISGKASGEFQAGDLVSFKLNGTTYSAAVDAAGNWSVKVAGADLAADTNIHATLVAHDAAGNSSSAVADHGYSVDLVAPVATLTINVVAGDDIVNAAEAMTNQTISGKAGGEFMAGDIVSFKLNGTDYSAKVAADGSWSVQVSGTDLSKGTSIDATLVAHDAAGNSSNATASHPYTVDLVAPVATLTINTVAGDDVVNLEESKVAQPISGKVTGEFQEGDIVSFKLNSTTYSTTVDKDGNWSVNVAGSDLAKETNIHATLVAHDVAGNVALIEADHGYSVDTTPPDDKTTTLTINVVAGDDVVDSLEAKTNQTISGKVTGEFTAGDKVSFKLDGTTYSAAVDKDGNWSVSVPGSKLVADSAHEIDATLKAHDKAGNVGDITASHAYSVALNSVSITSMSKDSAIDVAHSTDFITADGSAGRGVYGKLDLALASGEKVQVSFDGGKTWVTASTSGLNWTAVDTTAHTANWTIQARVVDGSGSPQTDVASQNVSFLGNQGGAPTITNIPDADSTYTTAKAADGSDVKVSLAGTIAKAGDTLHIVWGDTTFDHVLTAAEITAGTVTVTVPAQQTVQQGAKFDFAVTAQIISLEGQISSPSAAMQVHGEGWTTPATDTLQRTISTQGTSSVYQGGGFTITSNTKLSHYAGDTVSNAGVTFSGATTNYAQVNFTQPVDNFSIRISSLESTGSRVVVYDVDGNVLSDQQVKPDGTGGKTASKLYSFEAPIGADIGKVVIYCDGGGVVLDKLNYSQIHHAPGYIDTFANEIGKSGSFYSADGHFQLTATGKVSVLSDGTLYIGNPSVHENMNTSSATLTFDKPVQYISYDITAVEPSSGNGSLLQVYDTNGNLIFSRLCTNSGVVSGFEQISYTAPGGLSIGKVVIWNDDWGMKVDNFTSVLAPDVPTGQHEIDHGWETYFDEHSATYSEANYGQSFTVSAFSGGATLAGYHSAGGAFTITGAATKTAGGGTLWPAANQGSMFVDSAKTAVVTFDSARSEITLSATGIEKGNTAYLKVYDTDGTLLDTIQMTNPTGTYDIQSFSYEAEGNVIGRIEITGDTGGTAITSISSQVTQATTENDVISMVVDPVAYFAQDSAHIHGSSGLDTLKLTGANQVLDLTKLTGDNDLAKISSIEKFDITGTGNNTLKISLNDVLNLGETDLFHKDGKVQVMVDGDAGDKVQLANLHDHGTAPGAWQAAGTASIGGSTYNVYSYSNLDAEVLIKQAVTASIV
ncbi:Ig-like domain-containing protein [Pseudomonas nicosulfuronedens]